MQRRQRWLALALAGAVLAGGCARGGSSSSSDGSRKKQPLAPQFAPDAAGAGAKGSAGSSSGTTAPGTPAGSGTPGGPAPSDATAAAEASGEAALQDREGDATSSAVDTAPAWVDITGARLIRRTEGFELRVRLAGDAVPRSAPDAEHTMNIASFYDIDGDGRIDTEVWLNLGPRGWGAMWFDNVNRRAAPNEKSGVTVAPDGAEVVARFPLSHLAGATRFRWALASEWGRYETIGTAATARDDVPDNDGIARFPDGS